MAGSSLAANGRPERAHEVGVVWALLVAVFFLKLRICFCLEFAIQLYKN